MILKHLKKARCMFLVFNIHQLLLPVIRKVLQLSPADFTENDLGKMPNNSLGAGVFNFLRSNNLHLLPCYEAHDIKHVLLGYGATEEGEACLQYFFLGNGLRSAAVYLTVLVTWLIMPESWPAFIKAYKRGKQTPNLGNVNWFSLLPQTIESIHQNLKIATS